MPMDTRTRVALFAAVAVALVGVTVLLATRGSGGGRSEIVDTNDAPEAVAAPDPPTTTPPSPMALEIAASFRNNLVNQTGRQHLSLSDYIIIADTACDGAVNDPDRLLDLARSWDLGAYTSDETAAGTIWLAARQVCPERFSNQDFGSGPPFSDMRGGNTPPRVQLDALPAGFPEFVDVNVLETPVFSWSDGALLSLFPVTTLTVEEAIEHFRDGFPTTGL